MSWPEEHARLYVAMFTAIEAAQAFTANTEGDHSSGARIILAALDAEREAGRQEATRDPRDGVDWGGK